jgi:hypothetical protein
MNPTDAAILTALVLVITLLVAWYAHRRRGPQGVRSGYCAGPHNIGLYDQPYTGYPVYEGRGATRWDGDRRCVSYCQQSPCAVWCR